MPSDLPPPEPPESPVPGEPERESQVAGAPPSSGLPPAEPSGSEPQGDAHGLFLDRRVVPYWWITGVFSSVVFLAMVVAGLLVLRFRFPDYLTVGATAGGSLAFIRLFWSLIAPRWAWLRWRYRVDNELLRMRYGIIFHEERAIPVSRMQHVDMTRGPIERLFGLATLVVFTAGNEGSAFRVPGLAARTAEDLRDLILRARGDDIL